MGRTGLGRTCTVGGAARKQPPLQDGCLSLSIPQAVRVLVRSAGRARPGESAKGPEVRIPVVDPERRIQLIEPADEDQFLDVIVVSKQRQDAIGSAQSIAVLQIVLAPCTLPNISPGRSGIVSG